MSLVVLGTVALDNLKTPAGVKKNLLGGSASHFAMSARLFTNVHLVGIIGYDFPQKHITFFKEKGVCIASVSKGKEETFCWHGEYKKHDMNSAITKKTILGVLANYQPCIDKKLRKIPNVFLANIDPFSQMKCLALMKNPKLVGMDTMNLWINTQKKAVKQLLKKVNLFVLNDGEARLLTGEINLIKAVKILGKMGPDVIVLKKGEHGVLVYSQKYMFSFPAFPIHEVIDPTGAGDTFAGGLMGYLSKAGKMDEKSLRKAVLYATTIASFNVQGFGVAKTANLTLNDVNKRMKELVRYFST